MTAFNRIASLLRPFIPGKVRPSVICKRQLQTLQQTGRILAGPFAGMRYVESSVGSANSPKWLGTYEIELRGIIERWRRLPFKTIIDVGAAEGYYAIGCALAWPDAAIVAFETEQKGRKLITEMIGMNKLGGRIQIEGMCSPDDLSRAITPMGHTLVIMDVEGAECTLLDPSRIPLLKQCHIMVEVHDFIDRQIGGTLRERFSATHQVEEIWRRKRGMRDFAWPHSRVFRFYLLQSLRAYSSEWRPERMRWFALTPHEISGPSDDFNVQSDQESS